MGGVTTANMVRLPGISLTKFPVMGSILVGWCKRCVLTVSSRDSGGQGQGAD